MSSKFCNFVAEIKIIIPNTCIFMKKIIITLALTLVCANVFAQKFLEPDYIGQVVVLRPDSTTLLLPTETTSIKTSNNMMGYLPVPGSGLLSKSKSNLVMKGAEAQTVLDGKEIVLIIRGSDNNINPREVFDITKFEVKKGRRLLTLAESNVLGVKSNVDFNTENYDVKQYGEKSYWVILKNLSPGQYGVMTQDVSRVSTFMVR